MRESLANLETAILGAVARGDAVDACAQQFLLRRYLASGDAALGDSLGRALALTLDAPDALSVVESASRLVLFLDATALADDERIPPAIDALVARLRRAWGDASLEQSAAAIDACLHAAQHAAWQSIAADVVDALEEAIGRVYRPGKGVGGEADQVRAASALLAGYSLCGRVPYSMLAEELIQAARPDTMNDFTASCEAARVLCRLAALHDDPGYRASAIVAPAADYGPQAAGLLARQTDEAARRGAGGAIYGVAVLELESRSAELINPQSNNPQSEIPNPK